MKTPRKAAAIAAAVTGLLALPAIASADNFVSHTGTAGAAKTNVAFPFRSVVTVVLPATNGQILKIRKASTPEPVHREIYRALQIPFEVMKPVRTWNDPRT